MNKRLALRVLGLSMLLAASLPWQRAHAYSWTLVNYGPAPILSAVAHGVGPTCPNILIKLPPGGLHPTHSVSFGNELDICLVYKVEVSYTDPTGRDVTSPYVQEIKPSANAVAAARVKAQSDLAGAQAQLPAAQKELQDAQAAVNSGPHRMVGVAPWTPGGNPDATPGRPQASPEAEARLYKAQQAVYALENQINGLQNALATGNLVLIKEFAPEVWLAMMLESTAWALAGTYVVRMPPGVPPPSLPSLRLINASYISADVKQMRGAMAAFNKTVGCGW